MYYYCLVLTFSLVSIVLSDIEHVNNNKTKNHGHCGASLWTIYMVTMVMDSFSYATTSPNTISALQK